MALSKSPHLIIVEKPAEIVPTDNIWTILSLNEDSCVISQKLKLTFFPELTPHTWVDFLNYKNRFLWQKPVTFRRYAREIKRVGEPEINRECQIDENSINELFDNAIEKTNQSIIISSADGL